MNKWAITSLLLQSASVALWIISLILTATFSNDALLPYYHTQNLTWLWCTVIFSVLTLIAGGLLAHQYANDRTEPGARSWAKTAVIPLGALSLYFMGMAAEAITIAAHEPVGSTYADLWLPSIASGCFLAGMALSHMGHS